MIRLAPPPTLSAVACWGNRRVSHPLWERSSARKCVWEDQRGHIWRHAKPPVYHQLFFYFRGWSFKEHVLLHPPQYKAWGGYTLNISTMSQSESQKLQLQSLPIGYALLTHFTPIVFSCGSLWNLLDTRVFQSARLKPVPDASNALSIQVPHFSNTTTAVKHAYWQCTQPPHNRLAYTG